MQKQAILILSLFSVLVYSCKKDPLIEPVRIYAPQVTGENRQPTDPDIASIHQYLANVPADYNSKLLKKWPLMICLSGNGERGDDSVEIGRVKNNLTKNYPANASYILITPQLTKSYTAWYHPDLDLLVDQLKKKYHIDESRIMITGFSLGAKGVWDWTMANPGLFSCSVPIAGWGDANKAAALVNLPVWGFHNRYDDTIIPYGTTSIIDAIKAAGGTKTSLTLYDASGHGGWNETYANQSVINWMLAQKRP